MPAPAPIDHYAFAAEWEACGSVPEDVLRSCSARVLDEGPAYAATLGRARLLGAASSILRSASGQSLIRRLRPDFDTGTVAVADAAASLAVDDSSAELRLRGTASAFLNARCARHIVLAAPGPSLILIPVGVPGLRTEAAAHEGLRSASIGRICLEECVLPANHRLAVQAEAEDAFRRWRELDVLLQSGALLGMCEAAIADVTRYISQRKFDRGVLANKQVVRHRMADLCAELECARAFLVAGGVDVDQLALFVQQAARKIIDGALQLFGASGYMAANWISRGYRDVQCLYLLFGAGREMADRVLESKCKQNDISDYRRRARVFVSENVVPHLEEWECRRTLPAGLFRAFGQSGLLAPEPSPDGGRAGLPPLRNSVALVEELMRQRASSVAVSVLLPTNTVGPLLAQRAGAELRHRLLPGVLSGATPASLAVTEPTGGSDLLHSIQTVAESDGEHWLISGEKVYITNAPVAGLAIVLARTASNRGPLSMSLIAVPMNTPGVTTVERHEKLGLHASPTGRIRFDRARVSKSNTVGRVNLGFIYFTEAISEERLLIAAGATAFAASCLEETESRLDAAGLSMDSLVRREIASLRARLSASRAFVASIVERVEQGDKPIAECCAAKFAVCEAAQQAIARCMLLLDHFGCTGHGLAKAMSEARVLSICAGTSETMRDIYSDHLVRQALRQQNILGS
jgi:alkylation response protein AidB-like acyl-CoA dehydrogenase